MWYMPMIIGVYVALPFLAKLTSAFEMAGALLYQVSWQQYPVSWYLRLMYSSKKRCLLIFLWILSWTSHFWVERMVFISLEGIL